MHSVDQTKLKPDGSGLVFATYLGGDYTDRAYGLAVDRDGNAYVTGETQSVDFPTTPNVMQPTHGGDSDAFVLKDCDASPRIIQSRKHGASWLFGTWGEVLCRATVPIRWPD